MLKIQEGQGAESSTKRGKVLGDAGDGIQGLGKVKKVERQVWERKEHRLGCGDGLKMVSLRFLFLC